MQLMNLTRWAVQHKPTNTHSLRVPDLLQACCSQLRAEAGAAE